MTSERSIRAGPAVVRPAQQDQQRHREDPEPGDGSDTAQEGAVERLHRGQQRRRDHEGCDRQ